MPAFIDEHHQFHTDGEPIVNGFIYIGTQNADPKLNPITIYSDRGLTTPIANPQLTDSDGRSVNKIWIPGGYSLLIEDENNVQVYQELDNGEPVGSDPSIVPLINVSGTNTITADTNDTILSYTDNDIYILKAANANTGAVTLNIDSVGAKNLEHSKDTALKLGDIKQGQTLVVIYNSTEDNFQILNHGEPKVNPNASDAPDVNDDLTAGYTIGSEWIDIVNNTSYVCLDNNAAAAVWRVTARELNNYVATTDPQPSDDSSSGYVVGSEWVNTSTDISFKCVDNTAAAAVWVNTTNTAVITKDQWPEANNGSDADHDIDTTVGVTLDSTRANVMRAQATFGKQIDAVWVEGGTPGAPLGGRASAVTLAADQTLHFFIIGKNTSETAVDYGFDTSITATNLLSDAQGVDATYTLYRRIRSFITDGSSNLHPIVHYGDKTEYTTPVTDINTGTIGSVDGTVAISVPANVPYLIATIKAASTGVDGIRSVGQAALHNQIVRGSYVTGFLTTASLHNIRVDNANHDIQIDNNATSDDIRIDTLSYTDLRDEF